MIAHRAFDWSLQYHEVSESQALEIAKEAGLSAHDLDDTLLDQIALHDDVVRALHRLAYEVPADVARDARHLLAMEFGLFDGRVGAWL